MSASWSEWHRAGEVRIQRLAGRDFTFESSNGHWHWQGHSVVLEKLDRPALAGEFQLQNAAGVLALLEAADMPSYLARDTVNAAFGKLAMDLG